MTIQARKKKKFRKELLNKRCFVSRENYHLVILYGLFSNPEQLSTQ